ncbi:FLU1 Major facilitator superfamily multidrug transporter FLU1 [Candida maltosa Xu316]|uniref:Major facilitator superfamily (MFS) profile domain-containing protein n=1 Tax=Candida maltosa (strain Xu316) TaxID=1245528 RepID=M3HF84_CANMX|nr:hypothetical protein G210_3878 [Candida maltosa Xu316]
MSQQENNVAESTPAPNVENAPSIYSSSSEFSSRSDERGEDDEDEVTSLNADRAKEYGNTSNSRDYERFDDDLSRIESNTELSRRATQSLLNTESLIRSATQSSKPLPPMGGNKSYPPLLGSRDPYMVAFDGPDDPEHPHNYSTKKKILYCASVGMSAFSVAVGSAMFSQSTQSLMEIYHIGWTVATLTTSLYVFGFASGPVIYGPLSELFGRKIIMVPSCLGYVCFSFAVATAKDIQTIMICRFFAGFIGAAPLVVAPAVMADMFDNKSRGKAITIFSMILFGGPMIAPIMGGFTVKNAALGWRWTSYFCGIIGSLALIMNTFLLQETHHPLILVRRAEELRRRTGNWGIYAPHEEVTLSLKEIVENNISRPLVMLFTEPILFLISVYNAFIYGMLYLFLTAIPLIFIGRYHFVSGVGELPYLSMLIGVLIGGVTIMFFEKRYVNAMDKNNGKMIPEMRLEPMMVGGFTFVIGIFWLGWTGDYPEHVHWIVPVIGAAFVGHGLMTIFLPCFNYIIDCYLLYAATALAGNTFIRSAFGAVFPLFARQMFTNLTIKWAATLLGCVGVTLIPVPFVFYHYGKRIRSKSKYAFVLE